MPTVKELKVELGQVGLETTGLKSELMERLREHKLRPDPESAPEPAPGPAPAPEGSWRGPSAWTACSRSSKISYELSVCDSR